MKRPVAVNCAGCGARRVFKTAEALAKWAQAHKCWLGVD